MQPVVRRSLRLFILVFILAGTFSACSSLEGMLNFSRPTARVDRVELTGLSFDRADLLLYVRVDNPNPMGVRLAGLDYDFSIEEGSVLKGNLEKGIELSAGGSSVVEVPVSVGYQQIFTTARAAREKDRLGYGIDLGLSFAVPGFGSVRVPLEHRGELPVPRLPELKLDSIRVQRVSLTRIDLEINLRVLNRNSFGLSFRDFSYDLSVAGRSWVTGNRVRTLEFDSKEESVAVLPLSLNIVEVGRSVVDLLSGNRSLDYRFSGNTLIGSDLPLLSDYPFSFDSAGSAEIFR